MTGEVPFPEAEKGQAEDGQSTAPRAAAPPFPVPDEAMFHGLAGEIVNAIDPYTEACRPAVLVSLLSGIGAMMGRDAYVYAGFVRHPPSIWALLVGGTSIGAKGSADAAARLFLRAADSGFMLSRVLPSLSSGEGLIHQVRDASEKEDKDGVPLDEGVTDKRLYVVLPEFRTVMAQAKREANILSSVLRDAWDSPDVLCIPNKGDNAARATGAHIAMMAHVTPGEFRRKVDPSEIAGGTLNRYLFIASRSSKDLPQQREFPAEDLLAFAKRIREVVAYARGLRVKKIFRSEEAEELWVAKYPELKNPTRARTEDEEGIVASIVTRARPHVLRLALTYALLDQCDRIDVCHLKAALAVWEYSLASARWLFRDHGVEPELAKLRVFIDEAGPAGRTKTEITNVCFKKHKTERPIDELLASLGDDYEECTLPTGGRSRKVYRRKSAEQAEKAD